MFFDKLNGIYNLCFPLKNKKIKEKSISAPWMTNKLKKCIRKKYKLYNEYKRGLITKRSFNVYKNLLSHVTKKIREKYYKDKFNRDRDVKKVWSNINFVLNRKKNNNEVNLVDDNGNVVPREFVSEHMNNYFTSNVYELVASMPSNINWEYFKTIPRLLQSCILYPTNIVEVCTVMRELPNKGHIIFDIKPNLLLLIIDYISPIIEYLYNFCILRGVYPDKLKLARVVPIYKSGPKNVKSNYRPISNLCSINKIFEILTSRRLLSFFENFNVLSSYQYGFRELSSTNLAIFNLTNDILKTFNSKQFTIALFLDLKKAFDTVNLDILLHKLSFYGVRGNVLSFIRSYLTNRRQYVNVNGSSSGVKDVSVGVPQGSVLGPLFFNIFINDICKISSAKKILFADDAVFYITDSSFQSCIYKLNQLINQLSEWLLNNKLIANVSKTKLMVFTPKHIKDLPDIYFNNEILEWVTNIKYLGMIIDNDLSFISHSRQVFRKLSKLHGIIYVSSFFHNNL